MGAAVQISPDFERIQAQPVRVLSKEKGERLAKQLSPLLLTEEGKAHPVWGQGLQWLQALAIDEAMKRDGAYLQLPVGSGKTLLSYLFAYIFEAERPVLVVPNSLIKKTAIEFQTYRKYWVRPPKPPRIIGLRELVKRSNFVSANADGKRPKNLLERIKPDLFILDEVDMLKNQGSSMVKRLARYIDKHNVRTVAMTGTGGRFSILDISHLITWALKGRAPVPLDYDELCVWADALDERKRFEGFGKGRKRRTQPGVLLELIDLTRKDVELAPGQSVDDIEEIGFARAAFRKRLTSTVGCIISDTDSCDKPLTIKHTRAPYDRVIEKHFKLFRDKSITPTGDDVIDSLSFWALESAIGEGHCPRWKKPPPEWWSEPRKAYAKLCAEVIKRTAWSDNPLDTAGAVRAEFGDHPVVQEWEEVKTEWKGKRETIWHSYSVVEAAADWTERNHGIVWVKSLAFGEALADATGLPFYGAEGEDSKGRSIERDSGRRTVICSVASNMRGRNLQDRWHRNLVIGGVQSARYNEQLYGRTHRFGQTKPVWVEIMLTSGGSLYSFQRAKIEARFVHATQGHRQKILRAKHLTCPLPTNEERWVSNAA